MTVSSCPNGHLRHARPVISVMPDLIGHLSLKFVLHVADDLTVEEVDDALGAGCVFL